VTGSFAKLIHAQTELRLVNGKAISMQAPELRRFPYPYKAALSITSDIDCTDTCEQYNKIQSFMNEDVGIKFTNTFYPFHDQEKFSLLKEARSMRFTLLVKRRILTEKMR
jgi:hypothetical protein